MKQLFNKKATFGFLFAIGLGASLSAQWQLTGNAITNPATQFIGTTTNQPLVFRTNNVERFRITQTGRLQFYQINGANYDKNLYIGGGNENIQTADGLAANTAVGLGSMNLITTGRANTSSGSNSLQKITTGSFNVAIGTNSLLNNQIGSLNVGVGQNSSPNIIGDGNTSIGNQSFFILSNGNNNTSLGNKAGQNLVSGSNNIVIGAEINLPNSNASNQLNIGNWIIGNNGIIGIGTFTTPLPATGIKTGETEKYRLFVKDGIRTEKVKVDIASVNGWADFVFKEGYNLMPLEKVEAFIKENQHLPEIPSEKQIVAEGGIELKEMNVKLLQKIEELTLHLIEQNKRIKELENKLLK